MWISQVHRSRAATLARRASHYGFCQRRQNMDHSARGLPERAIRDIDANQHQVWTLDAFGEPGSDLGCVQLAHLRAIGDSGRRASELKIAAFAIVLKHEEDSRVAFDLTNLVAAVVGEEPKRPAECRKIALERHR